MKRALIVDDQLRWRKIFRTLLRKCLRDLEIQECASMSEALQVIESQAFDLAIIDLRLVDEDTHNVEGLKLMREAKAKSSMTKVILTTAYPKQLEDQHQEADAFIRKVPDQDIFNIKDFQETVINLMKT